MVADLFSLLAQTASPKGEAEKGGIAQSASPKGEAGKRRIAQSASTEREAEKETKDSRGVGKGKAGKRLVRRLGQTSSVCLRRQLPRRGKPGKGERQPRRWKGQSGEKVGAAVGADLFSLLAQTASPKGKPRKQERFRGVRA